MDEADILRIVRAKLDAGALRLCGARRTWGRRGTGMVCAICDGKITQETAEVESAGADDVARFYHVTCYRLLVEERTRRSTE